MAGNKSQKSRDDKPKKRKREPNDADQKPKRPRKDQQDGKVLENGKEAKKNASNVQNGQKSESKALAHHTTSSLEHAEDTDGNGWKVSKPMGGRMLDIDPILTEDEQNLIVTYNTSIQVYSATDSLLLRRIPISTRDSSSKKNSAPATIVATRLSKQNDELVWVACSDGRVLLVNWRHPSDEVHSFQTKSKTAKDLSLVLLGSGKTAQEVVVVAESDRSTRLDLIAYLIHEGPTPKSKEILSLKKNGFGLQFLQASEDGSVLYGALNDRLFVGAVSKGALESFDKLGYEFFSFDTPDLITTLDLRVGSKKSFGGGSASNSAPLDSDGQLNVIIGGARGAIYLYHDVLARLRAVGVSKSEKDTLHAQKYHWHRKAVHSLKWSRDGLYMISGGSENTLVLWQMDTSKKDFLPHLSGSIENIVVSPNGSSYVVHLDDNSAMILSTAEMKPTAYISGIQSAAAAVSLPKDMLVRRAWGTAGHVWRQIPAAIRSTEPSQLHICVGNGQQATMSGEFSAPLLQTFDLESFTSINRQPLARTQPTDVNLSNKGLHIEEPLVTHLAFSSDGQWLASVDVWNPAEKDIDHVSNGYKDQFLRERQEVYLKFWDVGSSEGSAALVSRINTPHATSQSETVLDLASDPMSACFATIGSDGMVRLWRPKLRQQNGIVSKDSDGRDISTWSCSQVIPVGEGLGQEAAVDLTHSATTSQPQGAVAFSEDGSTIFAAFGVLDAGVVYIIDASSGEVVRILEGLWTGKMRSIQALSPFLLILSDELRVFDVVGDELRYGIEMPKQTLGGDLLQLAVDYSSRHFAVATDTAEISSIGVFDPEEPEPLLVKSLPHRVVSLISTPKKSGFLALDDVAQVWTVTEGSDPSSLASMQPLVDLRLDEQPLANGDAPSALILEDSVMAIDDEEAYDSGKEAEDDVEMGDDDDDDGMYASVVVQQHLEDIFDAAPAFAGPSVEEMFYKVTNLLGAKPLVTASE